MICIVWDLSFEKLKGKKYRQNSSLKSYKNKIKILANPGLALSGFEQPHPEETGIQIPVSRKFEAAILLGNRRELKLSLPKQIVGCPWCVGMNM